MELYVKLFDSEPEISIDIQTILSKNLKIEDYIASVKYIIN